MELLNVNIPSWSDLRFWVPEAVLCGSFLVALLGDLLRIFVRRAARALAPIGAAVGEVGDDLESLEVYPVDLARVFLHLTGKELRD